LFTETSSLQPVTADYNPIAWFYDRHWSDHYHPWAVEVLGKRFWTDYRQERPFWMCACGNGVLARALVQHGYQVTGLDLSEQMLAYARVNVPTATFILADARNFHFSPRFARALSTFDSLNYVLTADELLDVFRNVYRALLPNGRFVFDLNLEERYRDYWGSTSSTVDEEHACFIRGSYDSETRIGQTEVTLFRGAAPAWQREDVLLLQRFHPADEVLTLLRRAGFQRAECLNAASDLGIEGHFSVARGVFTQAALHALEHACENVQPPLHRMELALHPWVTFLIMPIFALANAGVPLSGDVGSTLGEPITLGVILGLLLGKPLGITLASWIAVRSGVAALPAGTTSLQLHAAGWLGGIGFTMSLFIAGLAFQDEAMLNLAKVGILSASLFAGIIGSAILIRRG
jgi:SAM-dependent methyltransferase